jgi:DNA-binding HxlR family transcriptional regulator
MSKLWQGLKNELEKLSPQIIPILKSLANQTRFDILITLLDGEKSYKYLLMEVKLKKTALSNHLNQLLTASLIEKPSYGNYAITEDGTDYLRVLYKAFKDSLQYQEKQLRNLERKPMSKDFWGAFFKRKKP